MRNKTKKSYTDERNEHEIIHVYPFSSELKHMTTISNMEWKDKYFKIVKI